MKKYKFLVIDDQKGDSGWRRIFNKFLLNKYIATTLGYSEKNTALLEMDYAIYAPSDYYECNYNLKRIISELKRKNHEFDFFFIDIDFREFRGRIEVEGIKFTEDEEIKHISIGRIPKFVAGIFLLNYLKIDEKPKFLFSGSDKTLDLINYFQLLNMRLLDVSIVSVLPSSEGIDYPIMENRIDEYLLKRQVEVCQNQSLEKLIELKSIVEQWTEEKCPRCDEELIPDVSNKSKVEYWSLITLFPKQVLSIKSSKNFEENQRYLLEILRSDFRFLIWWVLSNHVNPLSYETDSDKVRNFKNRLMVLKHLDFSNLEEINEKASNYKGISSFEYFNDRKENGISMVDHTDVPKNTQIHKLRDKVVEVYKSSIKHHKPYIINEVVLGKNTEKFTEICRSSASEMWKEECPITGGDIVKMWAKWYGIYALDVLFIFEIAMLNKKRCEAKDCYFGLAYHPQCVEFYFFFDTPNEWLANPTNVDEAIGGVKSIAEKTLSVPKLRLQEEGIGEIVALVCKRYKGIFEFVADTRKVIVNQSSVKTEITPETSGYVFYKISIIGEMNEQGQRSIKNQIN